MTETASSGRMLLTDRAEPSEDAIIVPTSSVDITDVSRMDLDLKRQAQVEQRSKADPHAADKHFVQLLVKLLQKVGFKADLLFVDHLQGGIIPRPNFVEMFDNVSTKEEVKIDHLKTMDPLWYLHQW